jgi:hypothetical protein
VIYYYPLFTGSPAGQFYLDYRKRMPVSYRILHTRDFPSLDIGEVVHGYTFGIKAKDFAQEMLNRRIT